MLQWTWLGRYGKPGWTRVDQALNARKLALPRISNAMAHLANPLVLQQLLQRAQHVSTHSGLHACGADKAGRQRRVVKSLACECQSITPSVS